MPTIRERPPRPPAIRILAPDRAAPDYRSARAPLVIEQRWYAPRRLYGLAFMLAWLGGAIVVLWLGRGEALLIGALLLVIGLVGLYGAIAENVNHTRFTVTAGRIEIVSGPLPWLGARAVHTATIRQLFVRRRERRARNGKVVAYAWELVAVTDEGEIELAPWLTERDQVEYLEWAIEEHLGIVDQPERSQVDDE